MLKRRDKMGCVLSLLIVHRCFYFINTPPLVNVTLVMCMAKMFEAEHRLKVK